MHELFIHTHKEYVDLLLFTNWYKNLVACSENVYTLHKEYTLFYNYIGMRWKLKMGHLFYETKQLLLWKLLSMIVLLFGFFSHCQYSHYNIFTVTMGAINDWSFSY